MRCEPAHTIISNLGGVVETARLAGCSHASVSRWKTPKERGGTGGTIPVKNIPRLIESAKRELGVDLSWAEFEPKNETAE